MTSRSSASVPRNDSTILGSPSQEFEPVVVALAGPRWAVADAVLQVPSSPGLYAIYGDERAWSDLQLDPTPDRPLYVGKAEHSLVDRDIADHFATNPNAKPTTGRSTVRRSFAALLRDPLQLRAVPRNLDNPGYFAMYGLADGGDERLNAWMHSRLTIAVWPAPASMQVRLRQVEVTAIEHFLPPINLESNPAKIERLKRARAEMSAEAARWHPTAEQIHEA
jgi:hypothetical protein